MNSLNFSIIAVRKARFLEKKMNSGGSSNDILYELVQRFEDPLNIDSTETEVIASTYFSDASDSRSDTDSKSLDIEPFKKVDFLMKVGKILLLEAESGFDF